MLAQKDEYIREAAETIYQLSEEEMIRLQCEAREDYYRRQNDTERRMQMLLDTNRELLGTNKELKDTNRELKDTLQEQQASITTLQAEIERLRKLMPQQS